MILQGEVRDRDLQVNYKPDGKNPTGLCSSVISNVQ